MDDLHLQDIEMAAIGFYEIFLPLNLYEKHQYPEYKIMNALMSVIISLKSEIPSSV